MSAYKWCAVEREMFPEDDFDDPPKCLYHNGHRADGSGGGGISDPAEVDAGIDPGEVD